MQRPQLIHFLCLALVFSIPDAQNAPISLDRAGPRQPLYALDEGGRILVAEPPRIDIPARVLTRLPSSLKALDILATKLWTNQELIFVTAYGLAENDSRARMIQFSPSGQEQCEWILPEVSAGLDVDPKTHVIYVAGVWTGTIYGLKLIKDSCYGPNQLNRVLKVNGALRLGPLVMKHVEQPNDPGEEAFAWAADVVKGSVYRLDLMRGWSTEIARSLGQPVAMLFDSDHQLLYVLDKGSRRIWSIEVNRDLTPAPVVVSRDPALKDPTSITFASNGRLLVGDSSVRAIYTLTTVGKVVGQVPMP